MTLNNSGYKGIDLECGKHETRNIVIVNTCMFVCLCLRHYFTAVSSFW